MLSHVILVVMTGEHLELGVQIAQVSSLGDVNVTQALEAQPVQETVGDGFLLEERKDLELKKLITWSWEGMVRRLRRWLLRCFPSPLWSEYSFLWMLNGGTGNGWQYSPTCNRRCYRGKPWRSYGRTLLGS